MNLDTIEIPVDEARTRLREYEDSLKTNRNREDEAIARGYRIAAKGLPIIRLSEAVAAGGYFPNGLPRLAVCRADARICEVSVESWRSQPRHPGRSVIIFYDGAAADDRRANRGALVNANSVRVEVPPIRIDPGVLRTWHARTIVPIIPPALRPQPRRLRHFHILWEVEKWDPDPPRDPALIRHVGGDLWAVHATWDLTELERAILAGRR